MIERLRAFSAPLRYLIYVAGVLLVFSVAAGIGATAAVVVGWQFGRVATDSAETSTFESSMLETTALKERQKRRRASRPAIPRTPAIRPRRSRSSIVLRRRIAVEITPTSVTLA